jgi:SAM-dependent methyltransferase
MAMAEVMDRLVAAGYGLAYDAVVTGFPPYESLLDQIADRVGRSVPAGVDRRTIRVLDVACGTGTLARRLARDGYTVVGLDPVAHLVEVARRYSPGITFHHRDIARDSVPDGGCYDVLVSLHTLYWHPEPGGLLAGCRRALTRGGHGVFLTYTRPPRVARTFRDVAHDTGLGDGLSALRWLVPTAAFEMLRSCERRYLSVVEFHARLAQGGFELLSSAPAFLGGVSQMAWVRAAGGGP